MARGRGYLENSQRRLAVQRARMKSGAARKRGRGKSGKAAMPWDSQAQRESAGLGADSADARASTKAGYDRAQSELGFGSGASNPYGAVAENAKSLEDNRRGVTNTANNQLYAGSTLNAQSQVRSSYDKTQKEIDDQIASAQGDYTGGIGRIARDEQLGQAGIKEGALERAAASAPAPLGVGRPGGRGRLNGPKEGRNVRRPAAARAANAKARAINARLGGGRGKAGY
jgi:hypothetical protein